MTTEQSQVYLASQLRLMWWKFKRHRLALASGIFLAVLYFAILICEFLAPYNLHTRNIDFIYSPPQQVHLFHDGSFVGPFVYGRQMTLDMDTLKRNYIDNQDDVQRIRFFCHGDTYRFWGLFEADMHLVCPAENGQLFLLGTDRLGRDVLSRIIYGARISLTIGLVGITFQLHARHRHRRTGRLSRRCLRPDRSAHNRSSAIDPQHSAMAGSGGDHADNLESDPHLFRHHRHPRAARLDRTGARRAFKASGLARGGLRSGRAIDGRQEPAASSGGISFPASCRI